MTTLEHLKVVCAENAARSVHPTRHWWFNLDRAPLSLNWSTFFIARSTRWGVSESK